MFTFQIAELFIVWQKNYCRRRLPLSMDYARVGMVPSESSCTRVDGKENSKRCRWLSEEEVTQLLEAGARGCMILSCLP